MVGHPRGDGLFIQKPDEKVFNTVINKFKKNTANHIITHYEIFAKNYLATGRPRTSPLTVMDMIYYHVYGDLRLTTISGTTPSLSYAYRTNANLPHLRKVRDIADPFPFTQYLQDEVTTLGGFFAGTEESNIYNNIDWFNEELVRGNGGSRFHLNSLGTLLVKDHAFKDISKELSDALRDEIVSLIEFIDDNNVTIPGLEFDATVLGLDRDQISEDIDEPVCCTLLTYFFNNPEYLRLQEMYPQAIRAPDAILSALRNRLLNTSSKPTTIYDFVNIIITGLFAKSTNLFIVGQPVEVTASRAAPTVAQQLAQGGITILDHLEREGFMDVDPAHTTFVVSDVSFRRGNSRYQITWISEDGEEIIYPNRQHFGTIGDYNNAWIEERDLVKAYDPRFPEEGTLIHKKKAKSIQHPAIIEYQRILLDTFFCLQSLVSLSQHNDFAYISEGVNVDPKWRNVRAEYPNAGNPTADYPDPVFKPEDLTTSPKKNKLKQTNSLIVALTKDRNYVTLSSIINTRYLSSSNREQLDEFYTQDILMAEINWLSQALISEGTVLIQSTKEKDLLAHLQYRDVPGLAGVQATGIAPKETVFYQVEAPLLKDVIGQYIEVFNEMTISNAFRAGQQSRVIMQAETGLAKSIWGSIKSRLTDALDIEGIVPYILFSRLFAAVDEIVQSQTMVKTHFPPQWVGTDTIGILTTDPTHLNQKIEAKFYNDKLQEYLDYLMSRHINNHYLANAIVSSVEITKIQMAKDIEALKKYFINRIKNDDKKKRLIGTDFIFRPYPTVISILRSEISIPLQYRSEFAARGMDDQMRRELREEMTSFGRQKIILPSTHPDHQSTRMEYDPDSTLGEENNPNQLPMPEFYPKEGDELNLANPRVAVALTQLRDVILDSLALQVPARIFMQNILNHAFDPANNSRFIAGPIEWHTAAPQVWDSRESVVDPAQLLRVTQYRETRGIPFNVQIENFEFNGIPINLPPFVLDITPFPEIDGQVNWANYDSIFFRKRTGNRYDATGAFEPNNVYNRVGGAFTNPPKFGDDPTNDKEPKAFSVFIKAEDIEKLYAAAQAAAPVVPAPGPPAVPAVPAASGTHRKVLDLLKEAKRLSDSAEKSSGREKKDYYIKKGNLIEEALKLDVFNFIISDRSDNRFYGITWKPGDQDFKIHAQRRLVEKYLGRAAAPAAPAPSPVPAAVSEPPAVDFESVIPIIPEPDQIEKVEEIV